MIIYDHALKPINSLRHTPSAECCALMNYFRSLDHAIQGVERAATDAKSHDAESIFLAISSTLSERLAAAAKRWTCTSIFRRSSLLSCVICIRAMGQKFLATATSTWCDVVRSRAWTNELTTPKRPATDAATIGLTASRHITASARALNRSDFREKWREMWQAKDETQRVNETIEKEEDWK